MRGTVNNSFSHGSQTMVPRECVGDMKAGPHWDNSRDLGRRDADVVKWVDLLNYFDDIGEFDSAA